VTVIEYKKEINFKMKQILVLSCGRTGTNMLLESLRASPELQATTVPEDKHCFRHGRILYNKYLSKCDTVYIESLGQVDRLLKINPDLKILWTIRDLRDTSLSKIYRGQLGHDSSLVGNVADDATFEGCLEDISWMHHIYEHIINNYPERIKLVKMEDVILKYEETLTDVCKYCGISYREDMINFTERYRGSVKGTKGRRYKGLDPKQVGLHERKYQIYDGFYSRHDIDLQSLFNRLEEYQLVFGYTI
jgi:hypothetical protein